MKPSEKHSENEEIYIRFGSDYWNGIHSYIDSCVTYNMLHQIEITDMIKQIYSDKVFVNSKNEVFFKKCEAF